MVKLFEGLHRMGSSCRRLWIGRPRMLYAGPGGELYITRREGGDVLMLSDKDGDNRFEDLVTVAADFKEVHGITMKDGWMYFCSNRELRRYKVLEDGKLSKDSYAHAIYKVTSEGKASVFSKDKQFETEGFGVNGILSRRRCSTCG